MNIFFSSDHHYGHKNIIEYCNRPFSNVEDMDAFYIKQWNEVIKPKDYMYYLGDLSFHPEQYLDRLNGQIHYILGNHDFKKGNQIKQFKNVVSVERFATIKLDEIDITLCHYALRVWPKSHFNSISLHGHSHQHLGEWGKSLDVGIDSGYIFEWSEIKEIMKHKPNNPNLVKRNNSKGEIDADA